MRICGKGTYFRTGRKTRNGVSIVSQRGNWTGGKRRNRRFIMLNAIGWCWATYSPWGFFFFLFLSSSPLVLFTGRLEVGRVSKATLEVGQSRVGGSKLQGSSCPRVNRRTNGGWKSWEMLLKLAVQFVSLARYHSFSLTFYNIYIIYIICIYLTWCNR